MLGLRTTAEHYNNSIYFSVNLCGVLVEGDGDTGLNGVRRGMGRVGLLRIGVLGLGLGATGLTGLLFGMILYPHLLKN